MRRVKRTDDTLRVPGALTRIARVTRRLAPAHPGYWEGILIQGARQFAGIAMFGALAVALGGDHLVIGAVAAIPFLARMAQVGVPALVRRHGSWSIARLAVAVERSGFLAAAIAGAIRPGTWTIPLLLCGFAIGMVGQALYDGAMAALHSEVAEPHAFAQYTSMKTRWASISGLALGIVASFAVDHTEHLGVPPNVARAIAICVGIGVHCLIARPFARMGVLARERAQSDTGADAREGSGRELLPNTAEEWAVIHLALAWGFAYGIGARQSEAMALRMLGVSVGAITLLNAALLGAGIMGARTWGRLGDRFGGKGLMTLALTAFAIDPIWTMLALFFHPFAFVPAYLIWGVFNTGWSIAQTVALVRTTGEPADRVRLVTMYNVAYGVAAGVSPLIGGALLTWLDGPLSTRDAYASLFALTLLLRLGTIPIVRRLRVENAASARHVSYVYLRAVKAYAWRGTKTLGTVLRSSFLRE